jgi:hypothetical protein
MVKKQLTWLISGLAAILLTTACMLFAPPRGPLQFQPAVLPDAQLNAPYEAQITISDNATPVIDFTVSDGALPAGLTLQKVEGQDVARIFGSPTESGTFKFTVFVYCYGTNVSGQVGDQQYSVTVK